MKFFRDHHDDIRLFFLREPRGSMIQSINFIVPTENPEAAAAYIIAEAEEYPEMSGGNTISVATTMLKTGMVPITGPITRFKLEAPAGLIGIECDTSDGKVGAVRFINQPAFAYCLNKTIQLPGFGDLIVDVGYGGMTYAIVGAQQFGFDLVASEGRRLSDLGQEIKAAAAAQIPVTPSAEPRASRHYTNDVRDPGAAFGTGGRIEECRGRIAGTHRPVSPRHRHLCSPGCDACEGRNPSG